MRDCEDSQVRNPHEYIANNEDELFIFATDALGLDAATIAEKDKFQKRLASSKLNQLKGMKLHGQFANETEEKILRGPGTGSAMDM